MAMLPFRENRWPSEFPNSYDDELENVRAVDFKRLKDITYLDHAGTTLYSQRHLDAFYHDLSENVYGNPHSCSKSSRLSEEVIERTRHRVLQHFGTSAEEYDVIFTSGTTAALQMIARNFCFTNRENNNEKVDSIEAGCFFYLSDNHTSVLGMREVVRSRGHQVKCVTHDKVIQSLTSFSAPSHGNSLFAFPAQSNFSGRKYPLPWISELDDAWRCYVLLDAAAFVSTSHLDLRQHRPYFVSISFYKMFGFPTGLGALLVRHGSDRLLEKSYFGGGTIQVALAQEMFHVNKTGVSQRFEDGTVSFLDIVALGHGFDALENIAGSMIQISQHTFQLARYVHHRLASFRHGNGVAIATIYCDTDFEDETVQGSIITFNLNRPDKSFIGYAQVDQLAQLYNIHLRTGCFCNMGACQGHLQLTSTQIKDNYKNGHVCGDDRDVVNGSPTGAIRVSFGYMSVLADAKVFLQFINDCFVDQQVAPPSSEPTEQSDASMTTSGKPLTSVKTTENSECMDQQSIVQPQRDLTIVQPVGKLTRIHLFPIKSCAAFEVTRWPLGAQGLLYDRQWMIVNQSGVWLSQKRAPRMCLLQPLVDCDRRIMVLTFPGLDSVEVPLAEPLEGSTAVTICDSKVCGDRVRVFEYRGEVSTWLCEALRQPGLRLVRQSASQVRRSKTSLTADAHSLSLANRAQYLLINESSVRTLAEHINSTLIAERINPTETHDNFNECDLISRFRANFVVGGFSAMDERRWKRLRIGDHWFTSEGPCLRCPVISIDQSTGVQRKEPFRGLSTFGDRKLQFGILLHHQEDKGERENYISVDDVVRVES